MQKQNANKTYFGRFEKVTGKQKCPIPLFSESKYVLITTNCFPPFCRYPGTAPCFFHPPHHATYNFSVSLLDGYFHRLLFYQPDLWNKKNSTYATIR